MIALILLFLSRDHWWLFLLFFNFYTKEYIFVQSHICRLVNHFFHWSNILNFEAILSFHSFGSCKSTFVYETSVQFVPLVDVAILCTSIHLTSLVEFTLEHLFLSLFARIVHYFLKGSKESFVSLNTRSIGSYIDKIIDIIGVVVILLFSITWAVTTTNRAVIRITTSTVCRRAFTLLFWLRITVWNRQCCCFILYLWIQCFPFILCIFCILNFLLFLF